MNKAIKTLSIICVVLSIVDAFGLGYVLAQHGVVLF